jgi:class 3 adenylate cyclase
VNIAARVQALANSNQIIVSSDVYETAGVSESLAQLRVDIEEVQVRGVAETIKVYRASTPYQS